MRNSDQITIGKKHSTLLASCGPSQDQKQVLNEIATEESFERQIKKDKSLKSKQPEVQKAAINFTYEDGEGVVVKDDDKGVDEGEDDDDSDDDGPGVALIEEVMNPTLLSDHDKSMIDNKAMVGLKPSCKFTNDLALNSDFSEM